MANTASTRNRIRALCEDRALPFGEIAKALGTNEMSLLRYLVDLESIPVHKGTVAVIEASIGDAEKAAKAVKVVKAAGKANGK